MIPSPSRRRCLASLSAAALAALAAPGRPAAAQPAGWPGRPVRIVAPGAPGALFDLSARQIADKLAPALGQPVLVDNRPGAGGLVAMQHVARSAPDGHTFGVCAFTQLTVNPWMFDKPAYDPIADFAPITALFSSPIMLATRPDSPIGSFAQLLEVARALEAPDVRASYESTGRTPIGNPPEAFAAMIRDGVPKWRELVKVAGLKPE